MVRRFLAYVSRLRRRDTTEAEVEDELRFHVEMETAANIERGMATAEARRRAYRDLGGVVQTKEAIRDVRASWIASFSVVRDARYAIRLLRRRPGFTLVALLTLALGTGATTAIFAVLYNALLRPLPYPEPDRLVRLERTMTTDERGARAVGFESTFVDEMRESRTFQSLASYGRATFTLTGAGTADRITGEVVSASYFPTLGVRASIGRVFRADEDRTPGLRPVAIISESLWRSRLSGRQDVLGASIWLNRVSLTIVGVLPASFKGESGEATVWVPRMMEKAVLRNDWIPYITTVGRLRQGATLGQANAEVRRVVAAMRDAGRFRMEGSAVLLDEHRRDPRVQSMLLALLGAVCFVVLIACVNLANLLLARGIGRQREVAVRLSIGAGRAAILRQMLTECLILAFAGTGLGLLLAVSIVNALATLAPHDDTAVWPTFLHQLDASAFHVDAAICLFSIALAFLTTVLFGVAPALQAARVDVQSTLKVDTESPSANRRTGRMWRALIATEVAFVFVLLASAGLMLRSFDRLLQRPIGIELQGVTTFRLALPTDAYNQTQSQIFYERLLPALRALPGIRSVARVRHLPVRERGTVTDIKIDEGDERRYVGFNAVDPEFFRLFGIRLIDGRLFGDNDIASAPPVVLISESVARNLFRDRSPLGHRLMVMRASAQIVGIVADVWYEPQRPQLPIDGDVYVSFKQRPPTGAYIAARTEVDRGGITSAVRKIVAGLDPALAVYDFRTMEDYAEGGRSYARFTTTLLALFAALGLALAVVGIYGTVSYVSASRRREIGGRSSVLRMILREGLITCVGGFLVGLPIALLVMRSMRALLYQVRPADPIALGLAILILLTTAALACFIPALRAATLSPTDAIRR